MSKPVILTYIAQNPDQNYLRFLKEEYRHVKEAWLQYKKNKDVYYEIDYKENPFTQIDDIPKDISEYCDSIVLFHFAGHAGEQKIFLEDGQGHGNGLAGLLGGIDTLKLVFLNGCATFDQVDLLFEKGVKAVIATNYAISDDKAQRFATNFYNELSKAGRTIQQAYSQAMNILVFSDGVKREEYIVWDRGLATGKKDDSPLWQLFVNPGSEELLDDPYWWVIKNMALSRPKPEHAALPKLFFIYDEDAKADYEVIKDDLKPEIDKNKLLINGIYDIQPTLNITAVKAEIAAADVVFLLLRENKFTDFWKQLALKSENLEGKFIVFVKISDPDYTLEVLQENGIRASAIVPSKRWSNIFAVLASTTDDKLKKMMFRDVFKDDVENVIDVLPKYIQDFNFIIPKKDFESTLKSNQKILFACLEGTQSCGHNLLLRKFKEKFEEKNKLLIDVPISLKLNLFQTEADLEALIIKELELTGNLYTGLLDKIKNQHLMIIFDDFILQDNPVGSLVETQVKLIMKFYTRLHKELADKIVNTLFIVLINKNYEGKSLLSSVNLLDVEPIILCKLKPVECDEVETWKKDKDPASKILTKLHPDKLGLAWPSFIIPTVEAMGKQLQIPSRVLAKIFE